MARKLWEVTISKAFYVFSESPPTERECRNYAKQEYDDDVDIKPARQNYLGWEADALVYGTDEDVTIKQALAEMQETK